MCKYSKLNLNTFALSCCIAARWCTVTVSWVCTNVLLCSCCCDFCRKNTKIAPIRWDLWKTLKLKYSQSWTLFNFWVPNCKSQTPPLSVITLGWPGLTWSNLIGTAATLENLPVNKKLKGAAAAAATPFCCHQQLSWNESGLPRRRSYALITKPWQLTKYSSTIQDCWRFGSTSDNYHFQFRFNRPIFWT